MINPVYNPLCQDSCHLKKPNCWRSALRSFMPPTRLLPAMVCVSFHFDDSKCRIIAGHSHPVGFFSIFFHMQPSLCKNLTGHHLPLNCIIFALHGFLIFFVLMPWHLHEIHLPPHLGHISMLHPTWCMPPGKTPQSGHLVQTLSRSCFFIKKGTGLYFFPSIIRSCSIQDLAPDFIFPQSLHIVKKKILYRKNGRLQI